MRAPDALLCDACRPRIVPAVWRLSGTDRRGVRYRAVTCEACVEQLQQLTVERGGFAELRPIERGAVL